jgi:cytochrome c
LTLGALALAATASAAVAQAPVRPATFGQCAACHKVAAGQPHGIGPNLWGVGGRRAGSLAFAYSPAMKGSKIVWTKARLTAFIMDPRKVVPGNRMPYAGMKDAKAASALADYLMRLK